MQILTGLGIALMLNSTKLQGDKFGAWSPEKGRHQSQQCVVVSIYVDMCNRARSQMEKSRHTHAQQRGPVSTLGV